MTQRTQILDRLKKGNRNLPAAKKVLLHTLASEAATIKDGPEVKRDGT